MKKKIKNLRFASSVISLIFKKIDSQIKVGMNGKDLEEIAIEIMEEKGVKSSCFGYGGFPSHICVSINSELTHGIPNYKNFENGDLVSVDIACNYHGFHADAARTFLVFNKNLFSEEDFPQKKSLIDVTKGCLEIAISSLVPGITTNNDLGFIIESYAKKRGYFVIREYGGHGIGRNLHEDPFIPNCRIEEIEEFVIEKGMTICIEPLVQINNNEVVTSENFVVSSKHGDLNAHFEHTVLVGSKSVEVLV